MSYEGRHRSGPKRFAQGYEVAQRFTELGVHTQASVEIFEGVKGLAAGALGCQACQKLP
jgi:hypothetical protein